MRSRDRSVRLHAVPSLFVAVTIASSLFAGCIPVWHDTEPGTALAQSPDSLRATTVSGERWVLAVPRLSADSLVGFSWTEATGGSRVAIPADSVVKVETFDRTARTIAGVALMLASGVMLVASE